jgi:inosine/xanthosine triphosphatase
MKKIIVASTNPVKIKAALEGFKRMFPDEKSGVKDQPTSDQEIYQGALNRANNARKFIGNADYYVGLEGGIETKNAEMAVYAWTVVLSKEGKLGKSRSGMFLLPSKVAALINEGKELGEADDIVFGRINSKLTNGSVGILTNDVVTRFTYYSEAVILALIPFKNPKLY